MGGNDARDFFYFFYCTAELAIKPCRSSGGNDAREDIPVKDRQELFEIWD